MNHPFIHLLWKSYRSQREIWLTMLGGMLLLQLLVLPNVSQGETPMAIFLAITALIAAVFLCVSTLLMFVMEEEQGTALWLRLLPIKWWQQLTAGFLCSVTLTAVITLVGSTVGFVTAAYLQPEVPTQFLRNATLNDILSNITWLLPVWIVGSTACVLIRRVVIVLPVIVAIAVTNSILTFDLRITWLPIAASIVATCVLPFAVRRWQLGRPWTWWSTTASSNSSCPLCAHGGVFFGFSERFYSGMSVFSFGVFGGARPDDLSNRSKRLSPFESQLITSA